MWEQHCLLPLRKHFLDSPAPPATLAASMNILWWTILPTAALNHVKAAIVRLAQTAGIHTHHSNIKNPMSLKLSSMLAIITAAAAAIVRARQALDATRNALEQANAQLTPLQRDNAKLKIQLEQLETADEQLDTELGKLRSALDTADQPEVEAEDEVPAPPADPPAGNGSTSPGGGEPVPPVGGAAGDTVPVSSEPQIPSDGPADSAGPVGDKGPQGAEGTPSGSNT